MRFIFGLIVGCLLTVGAAYLHDAAVADPAVAEGSNPALMGSGRMVNWSVVDRNIHGLNDWVRAEWAWIMSQTNRAG